MRLPVHFYPPLLIIAFVLCLASLGSHALAQSSGGIDLQAAERIALEHFPGAQVESVERDTENGVAVIEVELTTSDGVERELVLDARDGRVISDEVDD